MTDLQPQRDPIVVIYFASANVAFDYQWATELEQHDTMLPPGSLIRFHGEDYATLMHMTRMHWLARAFRHLTIVEPGVIAH